MARPMAICLCLGYSITLGYSPIALTLALALVLGINLIGLLAYSTRTMVMTRPTPNRSTRPKARDIAL